MARIDREPFPTSTEVATHWLTHHTGTLPPAGDGFPPIDGASILEAHLAAHGRKEHQDRVGLKGLPLPFELEMSTAGERPHEHFAPGAENPIPSATERPRGRLPVLRSLLG